MATRSEGPDSPSFYGLADGEARLRPFQSRAFKLKLG